MVCRSAQLVDLPRRGKPDVPFEARSCAYSFDSAKLEPMPVCAVLIPPRVDHRFRRASSFATLASVSELLFKIARWQSNHT